MARYFKIIEIDEDSGLEPREILSAIETANIACALNELDQYKELGDLYYLRELVQADREGRCVVLPCKVGDTVYVVGSNTISEATIQEIYFGCDGEIEVLITFTCDGVCDGCPFKTYKINDSGEWHCIGEYGELYTTLGEFEKNLFLTREAAEAALKERKKDEKGNKQRL